MGYWNIFSEKVQELGNYLQKQVTEGLNGHESDNSIIKSHNDSCKKKSNIATKKKSSPKKTISNSTSEFLASGVDRIGDTIGDTIDDICNLF